MSLVKSRRSHVGARVDHRGRFSGWVLCWLLLHVGIPAWAQDADEQALAAPEEEEEDEVGGEDPAVGGGQGPVGGTRAPTPPFDENQACVAGNLTDDSLTDVASALTSNSSDPDLLHTVCIRAFELTCQVQRHQGCDSGEVRLLDQPSNQELESELEAAIAATESELPTLAIHLENALLLHLMFSTPRTGPVPPAPAAGANPGEPEDCPVQGELNDTQLLACVDDLVREFKGRETPNRRDFVRRVGRVVAHLSLSTMVPTRFLSTLKILELGATPALAPSAPIEHLLPAYFAYEGLCPDGNRVPLLEADGGTYELDSRGGVDVDRFGRRPEFELPSLPDVLVRATVGSTVVACEWVPRSASRTWGISPPPNAAPDAIVTLEVYRMGPKNESQREAALRARRVRIRELVESVIFLDEEYWRAHRRDRAGSRDFRSLLREAIDTRNATRRDELIDLASRQPVIPDGIPMLFTADQDLEISELRDYTEALRDRHREDLAALRTSWWTARARTEALAEVTPIPKAQEILNWYLSTPVDLQPSRILRHRLPVDSRRWHAHRGMSRRVVRWGREDTDDTMDRGGRRVAVIVTHVPRGTSPGFRQNEARTPRQDIAVPLMRFTQVFFGALLAQGPQGELPVLVDPALPTEAAVETHTFISRPVQRGTSLALWVCDGDCPTSDGDKVRNRVSVDGDRLFGLAVLASFGVGRYPTSDRLVLREAGGGQPDEFYRVTSDADRTVLFGAIGLGIRVWNIMVSANVLSVGPDIPKFRSWLFGAGFRIRSLSEHTYLQFLGGFARPQIFTGVSDGDLVTSPEGMAPSLETRRRRIPLLGVVLSFDIIGLGSDAASFAKKVGAN
ncbi:MAG: hypothetical protein JJ863_24770 [Deltaproteobacteria bacterium]|nr:hypothetical protein [Deltaproteobacteria bacterium]